MNTALKAKPPNALRILLVDGHRLFRAGIRELLAGHADLIIAEEAGSGDEALKKLAQTEVDVVVMEIRLPDMNGIEVLRKLRAMSHQAHVLFLTTVNEPDTLLVAAEAGAAGYILKDISPENLMNAIRAVHSGRTMVHPVLARRMLQQMEMKAKGMARARVHGLNETELSVLSNLVRGLSDREIAANLHLSEATVKKHLRQIYVKLGARNRAQAALLAVQNRLVQ